MNITMFFLLFHSFHHFPFIHVSTSINIHLISLQRLINSNSNGQDVYIWLLVDPFSNHSYISTLAMRQIDCVEVQREGQEKSTSEQ